LSLHRPIDLPAQRRATPLKLLTGGWKTHRGVQLTVPPA
jgi:hypothetical protein